MKGRYHSSVDKCNHINQIIRDRKFAILAAQETHLNKEDTQTLQERFPQMKIFLTIDTAQKNSKGVAVVLNNNLIPTKNTTEVVIIEGRALAIIVQWHTNENLCILAVYTPNAPKDNKEFWKELNAELTNKNIKPNLMLGDFNLVKDSRDRLPAHRDDTMPHKH